MFCGGYSNRSDHSGPKGSDSYDGDENVSDEIWNELIG